MSSRPSYKYDSVLVGLSLVCSRPSGVWLWHRSHAAYASMEIYALARSENSVQAIVLGRHEVCLTPVRTSSNSQQSTMQCTLKPTTRVLEFHCVVSFVPNNRLIFAAEWAGWLLYWSLSLKIWVETAGLMVFLMPGGRLLLHAPLKIETVKWDS